MFTAQPGADTPDTDPGHYRFAGVMGQISSSVADMTAEPGFIMIDKPYQVRSTARRARLTLCSGLMFSRMAQGS